MQLQDFGLGKNKETYVEYLWLRKIRPTFRQSRQHLKWRVIEDQLDISIKDFVTEETKILCGPLDQSLVQWQL